MATTHPPEPAPLFHAGSSGYRGDEAVVVDQRNGPQVEQSWPSGQPVVDGEVGEGSSRWVGTSSVAG